MQSDRATAKIGRKRNGEDSGRAAFGDLSPIGAARSSTVIRRKVRRSADQIFEKPSKRTRADKCAAQVGLPRSTSVLPPLPTRAAGRYRRSLRHISVPIAQPSTRPKVQWPRYIDQRAGDSCSAEKICAAWGVANLGRKADYPLTGSEAAYGPTRLLVTS